MNISKFIAATSLASLTMMPVIASAEDIDIYSSLGIEGTVPNVLFVMDTGANFSSNAAVPCTAYESGGAPSLGGTGGGVEQCALVNAIESLPDETVNIGIMVNNGNGFTDGAAADVGPCINSNGGCLVRPLTFMDAAGKASLINFIKSWQLSGSNSATQFVIKSGGDRTGSNIQEAWAYYNGKVGLSGKDYQTSIIDSGCQRNFIINIGNSFSNSGGPGDTSTSDPNDAIYGLTSSQVAASDELRTKLTDTIKFPSTTCGVNQLAAGSQASDWSENWADEWTRYMYQSDASESLEGRQNIITYTIGVINNGTNTCKPDYPALLTNMARYGGGKYFQTGNADEVKNALLQILNEVQAVNSVFSSSSLPVSVNAQGTFLNQIFMGMFRPDQSALPRWRGNLKQYQFVFDENSGSLALGDSEGNLALSSAGTGFISPNAISFWTSRDDTTAPDLNGGFWINDPQSTGEAFDSPDGELVEKGGAAQMLRLANLTNNSGTNNRNIYTYCPSGTCDSDLSASVNAFTHDNSLITDAMLGTGARTITAITSEATIADFVPVQTVSANGSGTVSITQISKSGSTVTATVSAADILQISVGTQITIATGVNRFDCSPCNVASVDGNQFSYAKSGGGSATPAVPFSANITSNLVEVSHAAHTRMVGQMVTFAASCTGTANVLNSIVGTVSAVNSGVSFRVNLPISAAGINGTCRYTPNTATATSAGHGLPSGESVAISGASPTGYNGTWTITVTGENSFTYQYSSAAPLAAFAGSATGVASTTTKESLIKWVRGYDYKDDELGPGGSVNVRPSIHGDVLHSRPVVLNYGDDIGIVAFYGSNDGMFRAVNGNQTGDGAGEELWGFIPKEFLGNLKRQHDNSPQLLLPTTLPGITPAPRKKDYFVDGPTSVYQVFNADGTTDTAYIYLTMRRGGRFIYALDVTDPNDPQLLWKKSNTDAGFAELGQTWSQATVAKLKGYVDGDGNEKPVIIFGGGYDVAEDSEPPTANTMGRGIFVVDATTGALVWSVTKTGASCATGATCIVANTMDYAIPSDVAVIDKDRDGNIDRMYVGDLGGNIWRVDFEPTATGAPDTWQVNKLAAVGCDTGVCTTETARKFFFPPDVVPSVSSDLVLIGSGDREHPLYSSPSLTVTNRFYVIKDTNTDNDGSGATTINETNLFNATSNEYDDSLSGFYITLALGEKVVNAPATIAGTTFFGTNQPLAPNALSCETKLGIARGYAISPFSGEFDSVEFDGGGLPPSPVYGLVNIQTGVDSEGNPITELVPFCIGCGGAGNPDCTGPDCKSALGGGKPNISVSSDRRRTFWSIDRD